jgi:flagellar rod assembly protein/muramidase FlgJ
MSPLCLTMTVLSVNASTPGGQAMSRPAAASAPVPGFAQSLAWAQAPAAARGEIREITVRGGDTLSGLVERHLRLISPQLNLSPTQLYQLAVAVAKDNDIAAIGSIRPGQVIDVSAVQARAHALASGERPALDAVRSAGVDFGSAPARPIAAPPALAPAVAPDQAPPRVSGPPVSLRSTGSAAGDFMVRHAAAAQKTEAASGIPAHYMLAQAALETGWGRREIRGADGRNSFNLFGIRTGANWRGPSVDIMTTEYVNGVPERMVGRFRAYSSYEESFADYARLISQSPRYAQVMKNTGDPVAFASALQRAGYATGPHYASALASLINATSRMRASVPQVQMALAAGQQAPAPAPAMAAVPAAEELRLRWSAIAPMPGSAIAQAAAARASSSPAFYASADSPRRF